MKKILLALLALAPVCASAQTTVTPHVGLEVPAYGSSNWQVPLGFSLNRLDQLLSGNATLPGLTLSGPIVLPGPPTLSSQAATKAYVDAVAGSGNATQIQGSPISATAPTSGQFFGWNGTSWGPVTVNAANATSLQSIPIAATAPNDGQALTYQASTNSYLPATVGGGSQRIVYTSKLLGTFGDATVAPGSSAAGATDRAAAINAALNGGNVRLVIDGQYGLASSLIVSSNTEIACLPGMGLIMKPASNVPMFMNAHPNAATTASGTGGYLPSNITDFYLAFHGCRFNFNSTQAVTGTDPLYGIAHKVSAITGKWTLGMQFLGVSHLDISNNETYDSGTYSVGISNAQYVNFQNNIVHQPLPLVALKNTDGLHVVGPAQFININGNHINAGDDSIALNADDGNRTGSGDPNGSYVQFAGWRWGPITDVHGDGNTIDYSITGLRLLSGTELIDRIYFSNTSGSSKSGPGSIGAFHAFGPGNMGRVTINNWDVQADGTNTQGSADVFGLDTNISSLSLCGVHYANASINWPIIHQYSGAIGALSLCNWQIDTTTGTTPTDLVETDAGTIGLLTMNGLNWLDVVSDTAPAFAGSVVPGLLTVSNYAGPNRLLASGYAPAHQNGDAFTNTYPPTTITYISTTFTEAASGTPLNGTTPAICAHGCTGTWVGSPTSAWQYSSGGAIESASVSGQYYAVMNAGVSNYVIRATVTSNTPSGQLLFRFTDLNNYVLANLVNGSLTIYDVEAGTATAIGSVSGANFQTGSFVVTVNGSNISVTSGGLTAIGTLPGGSANLTSGMVGFNMYGLSGMTVSTFTVANQ